MSTHAIELPRVTSADVKQLFDSQRRDLLDRAVDKLKYRIADTRTLLGKLAFLDILPFQTSAVDAYKKSKEHVGIWSGTRNWLLWITGQLAAVALLIYIGLTIAPWSIPGTLAAIECLALIVGGYIIIGVVGTIVCLSNVDMVGHGSRSKTEWYRAALPNYTGVIPDHVLNIALQIQEAVPTASFSVNYLETVNDYKERPVRDPDPFLVVALNNESYYVEQWDERDFPRADSGVV
jgi:hypothetical protein